VHEELFGRAFAELGEQAALDVATPDTSGARHRTRPEGTRLVRYRPLFSGPAVERVPKFEFQRPNGDVELSPEQARELGVRGGDVVTVRTNGTSAQLRARIRRGLEAGIVLVAEGAADELVPGDVEVTRA
jgi:predicted molibdopterin-dependent oxidoreductase YjgC